MKYKMGLVLISGILIFLNAGCEFPPSTDWGGGSGAGQMCNPVVYANPQYRSPAVFLPNGEFAINAISLQKYRSDASIDPAFAPVSGVGSFGFEPDGSVMALSSITCPNPYCVFGLQHFLPDGIQDNSFSPQMPNLGALINTSEMTSDGAKLVVGTDNKILATSCVYNGDSSQFVLIRWNANGSLDTSFGNNGAVVSDSANSPGDCQMIQTTLNSDGSLASLVSRNGSAFSLAVFSASGVEASETPLSWNSPALVPSPLGFLVDETLSNNDIALSLWKTSPPSIDTGFGEQGYVELSNELYASHVEISQPNGAIVVAGLDSSGILNVGRYTTLGQLDPTFGTAGEVQIPESEGVYVNGGSVGSGGAILIVITNQLSASEVLPDQACGDYIPATYGISVVNLNSSGVPE